MNKKDFNFDAVTSFNLIKHRGGMENCFRFCLSKKITDIWESSHRELGVFLTGNLRCSGW